MSNNTVQLVEKIDQFNIQCDKKFQPSYFPTIGQTFKPSFSGFLTGIEIAIYTPCDAYEMVVRNDKGVEIAKTTFILKTPYDPYKVVFDLKSYIYLEADKQYSFSVTCTHPMANSVIAWISTENCYDRGTMLDNKEDKTQYEFDGGIDMYFRIFMCT